MSVDVAFNLGGFRELDQALQRLGREFAGPALQRAVDAGAVVMESAVRAAAPVRRSPARGILIGGGVLSRKMAKRIALRSARAGGAAVQLTKAERRALARRVTRLQQGRRRFPGFLRREIGSTKARLLKAGEVRARVGVGNAFYGKFLELGTVKMSARSWMAPAALSAAPQVVQVVAAKLRVEITYAPRRR